MTAPLRIATRKSALALWQAEHVAALLRQAHPGLVVELVPLSTRGDEILDRSLATIGGKGLLLKELEVAMQEGRADIAVHSLKDVPAVLEPGFALSAILPRADSADGFISNDYATIAELPNGARVGTSSLRRQAQLRALPNRTDRLRREWPPHARLSGPRIGTSTSKSFARRFRARIPKASRCAAHARRAFPWSEHWTTFKTKFLRTNWLRSSMNSPT